MHKILDLKLYKYDVHFNPCTAVHSTHESLSYDEQR